MAFLFVMYESKKLLVQVLKSMYAMHICMYVGMQGMVWYIIYVSMYEGMQGMVWHVCMSV